MLVNRIATNRPDYILAVVRVPNGWQPKHLEDVPAGAEVLSVDYVASYEEAHDDLVRCNQFATDQKLKKWAVIQCPDGQL